MANALGFNLGQVYTTVEGVKNARQGREIQQEQLGMLKDEAAQKKAEMAQYNALSGVREQAAGGDVDAQRKLLALDPKNGPSFIEAVQKMDEGQRASVKQNIEALGQMSFEILNAATPEEKNRLYLQAYSMADEKTRAGMPPQYNEDFLRLTLAKVKTMDQLLENPEVLKYGQEDVMVKQGKEIGRAQRPEKETEATGNGAPKTSDYNLVLRSIVPAIGGTIDDQGNIRGIKDSTELNAIAELASKLLRTGESASPIEAGAEALRRYGKTIKTPQQSSDPSNPAGIGEFFLKRPQQ